MLRTCWAPTSVRALLPPLACSFMITFAAWPRSCSLLTAKAVAQTSSCSNILNAPHINLVHVRTCTPELARRGAEVLEAAIAHRTRPITLSDLAICSFAHALQAHCTKGRQVVECDGHCRGIRVPSCAVVFFAPSVQIPPCCHASLAQASLQK